MTREIVKPTSEYYSLQYINQKLEIFVLPFSEIKKQKKVDEIQAFSEHSANLVEEWKDDSEDDVWK
ncbi:MAG: hypothetical protein ACLFOC_09285 [Campylobacterales bacterium]